MRTRPAAGFTSRTMARPIVVLPEPLSPTRPRPNGPSGTLKETPSTARTGPNRTSRCSTSSTGRPRPQPRYRGDQLPRVGLRRRVQDVGDDAGLDDLAAPHHGDPAA